MPSRKTKAAAWQAVVDYRVLSSLTPHLNNPKLHTELQLRALGRSMVAHGFVSPILIDAGGIIIAGHARFEAAKLIGIEKVPTIKLEHLTPAQQRAYRIADNRLAEVGASWSIEKLNIEVASILEIDGEYDLSLTGFDPRDLELALDVAEVEKTTPDPDVPAVEANSVSQPGDLWQIGDHILLCGTALEQASYSALLKNERADMMFSDPPFNVPINGHVSGKGRAKHREFLEASGEMTSSEFQQFLSVFLMQAGRASKPGSLHYVCMDWRHIGALLSAGSVAFDELKNLCVWAKSNAGMGSLYRSQHELVAVFKKGGAAHINNVELGKNGRNRTNVWAYAGMNSFSSERNETLALHPTCKPLALVRDAILDASRRDDIILDPFGGSGTTLLAADACRRRARLIELDPLYCDVIVRRAEKTLGLEATLAKTSQTFSCVASGRAVANV
jgi:DNA modification methylase